MLSISDYIEDVLCVYLWVLIRNLCIGNTRLCSGNIFIGSDAYLLCEKNYSMCLIVYWDFFPQYCISAGFFVNESRDFYRNEHLDYFGMIVNMIYATGLIWFREFMINLEKQLPEENK